ncbi:MAG: hypothetical protein EOP45_11880 [Sphingobacteriaceae bacterium]|nr:MAG: hypothetical protein EOP45_11880 [Sphingobacteriaceae bacterium]
MSKVIDWLRKKNFSINRETRSKSSLTLTLTPVGKYDPTNVPSVYVISKTAFSRFHHTINHLCDMPVDYTVRKTHFYNDMVEHFLSGRVASGSNSSTVINLGQTLTATQANDIVGAWIKVIDPADTTLIQIRRIKYATNDGIVTIFSYQPFTIIPSNTMTYNIYRDLKYSDYVWVGSTKRFRFR